MKQIKLDKQHKKQHKAMRKLKKAGRGKCWASAD